MNIKEFSQPTILTGKQYGTTITIELDHSDTSIDEVMDGMLTIVKGLGYLDTTINEWVKQKAKDVYDDEHQIVKDALSEDNQIDWFDQEDYSGQFKDWENETPTDEYDDFVDSNWDEDRMDVIGQNGNEGTHYDTDMGIATDEDMEECKLNDVVDMETGEVFYDFDGDAFDDYGMRIPPNDKLKAATQRYSDEVKAKHKPVKLDKSKVVRGKIKDLKK